MKWNIYNERFDMTDLMVNIEFMPENKPLRYFLSGVDLISYPKLLNLLCKGDSYFQSRMSLRFYKDLDWEDLQGLREFGDIQEDDVVIYHEIFGERIIKESIFFQVLLDYAVKLLEAYKNDSNLPSQWGEEMQKEINQLRGRIGYQA